MGLPDKHDERKFRHFAKIDASGVAVSIIEVADGRTDPTDQSNAVYVEVTDLYPYDFSGVVVPRPSVLVSAKQDDQSPNASVAAAEATVKAHLASANKVKRG